ncbi:NAD(P)H-dependent oxidoreductase [Candidatus Gracilibacteria bacterium]|nr:MAG: NAD(P)H-dependent oxidoreductase [Candidatus Gracilibacteria bacterium]PIE85310.1 MAG: NAD(P)H-dependent oxidoreductase [Candidatus Gracilibacteria bacterium]
MKKDSLLSALKWRYAVKKFDANKKVSETDLQELVEAFILTPSSFGLQPWKLIYVEDIKKREEISKYCYNDSQILDSSGVFVFARNTDISSKLIDKFIDFIVEKTKIQKQALEGYENIMKGFILGLSKLEKEFWAEKQVMIALGNVMNVCALKQIDSCPIEGFQKEKLDEILSLKEKGLASVVLLPIGYRDENDGHLKKGKIRYNKQMMFERV